MDENSALIEAILREQEEEQANLRGNRKEQNGNVNEWQTVSYKKRNRNKSASKQPLAADDDGFSSDVFRSVEQHSEERRHRLMEAQIAAASTESSGSKLHSYDDIEEEDKDSYKQLNRNGSSSDSKEEKAKAKAKKKKKKQPKVTVAEAASGINADDLGAFLAEITVSVDNFDFIDLFFSLLNEFFVLCIVFFLKKNWIACGV